MRSLFKNVSIALTGKPSSIRWHYICPASARATQAEAALCGYEVIYSEGNSSVIGSARDLPGYIHRVQRVRATIQQTS
jgi:hypothetical protein